MVRIFISCNLTKEMEIKLQLRKPNCSIAANVGHNIERQHI